MGDGIRQSQLAGKEGNLRFIVNTRNKPPRRGHPSFLRDMPVLGLPLFILYFKNLLTDLEGG
jgi:hypothetical protein